MFLFIFESIGTSELILIGAVALIVFGPRKLPQLAKTLGRTMADFKNTTNEFKTTWEREVNFEEVNSITDTTVLPTISQTSQLNSGINGTEKSVVIPEIKEIDAAHFNLTPETKIETNHETSSQPLQDKKNWL